MYKIIACDLDETLIRTDRTISKEDKKAIQAARELGIRFVSATGRGYESVDVTLEELGLIDATGEYVISFNGGCVTENAGASPHTLSRSRSRSGRKAVAAWCWLRRVHACLCNRDVSRL